MILKSVGGWVDQGGKVQGVGRGKSTHDRTGRDKTNDSWVQAQMDRFLAVFAGTRGRV